MRTRPARARRRALIPILIAGALGFGATAASGVGPSVPVEIPDAAFQAVTVDALPGAATGAPFTAGNAPPIVDPWLEAPAPPSRARPSLPPAEPIAIARPAATPKAGGTSSSGGGHSISGRASWYCDAGVSPCTSGYPDTTGFDAYGAAGPRLRAAIGSGWRGKIVTVDGIRVKLVDWCQCYAGEDNEKLIDLYRDVFLRTGSAVTIRW